MTTPESAHAPSPSVNDLIAGQSAIIDHLNGLPSPIRQRLLDLGLVRGMRVQFIRSAPLNDPIEIAVCGYRLSIRRKEASKIIVHTISG